MPKLYAGEVFQTFARSHGIVLKNAEQMSGPVHGKLLVERKSQPLQYILKNMLKYSNNLTAEVTGLSANVARGKRVDNLAESANEMSRWMRGRLGTSKPQFIDHSNLSDSTQLSSDDLVEALVRISPNSTLATIMKTLPVRNAKNNVRNTSQVSLQAKTKTLNFVSGLTRFISSGDNGQLTFAIFATDLPRRDTLSIAERERPPDAKTWNGQAKRLQ